MNLFAISSNVPCPLDNRMGVTAVNVIVYELLRQMLSKGHRIHLQIIYNRHQRQNRLAPEEETDLSHLQELGIRLLPPIYFEEYGLPSGTNPRWQRLGRLQRLMMGRVRIEELYPSVRLAPRLKERIRDCGADSILTLLTPEGVAAVHPLRDWPVISYQGDVDFMPAEARMKALALFPNESSHPLVDRFWLAKFKKTHLRLMRDVDLIANVTACNAEFYRLHGHPRSVYIRNTWRDPGVQEWAVPAAPPRTIKIIGHAGNLQTTGSTFGLKFLSVDLLPELEKVMAGLDYEIHVIGGGQPSLALKPYLSHPRIRMRGFVPDLDREIRESDLYLLLNNAGPYQAAFTRHLVAWSMGLCLVVHANSTRAIPELAHMENALIGSSAPEIARLIRRAATDPELNRRIRKGGRSAYERFFTPGAVADALERQISPLVTVSHAVKSVAKQADDGV